MKPAGHAIASGIISAIVLYYFKSVPAAVSSFLAGTIIDLDHFFDFYANHHFTLSLKKVYKACADANFRRLYVLGHSYELVAALWLVIIFFSLGIFWIGVAIGLTQHLILDQITNPIKLPAYFLTYRIMKKFKKEGIAR